VINLCHRSACAAILVAATLLTACNRQPETPAAPADAWATVNGRHILAADVDAAYNQARDPNITLSAEEVQAAKMQVLDDLITQDLLMAKAMELMIDVTQADIDTAVTQARGNLTEEAFQQELQKRGLNADSLRSQIRRDLLVNKVLESQTTAKVSVTDAEVTEFFNANQAQFNLAEESYRLAQIVITPVAEPAGTNSTGNDATSPQAVQQKVQMLMQRLQAGESFPDLAAQFSEDAESAARGGDLGLIPVSAVRQAGPALRDAVLNTTPGNARVINQNGAAAIVLVAAKEPAGQRTLETPGVKDQITQVLRQRREQLLRSAYLTALHSDADIDNHAARRIVENNGRI
jgi:peptidyl-prolyl cis-trans isomerase SurA